MAVVCDGDVRWCCCSGGGVRREKWRQLRESRGGVSPEVMEGRGKREEAKCGGGFRKRGRRLQGEGGAGCMWSEKIGRRGRGRESGGASPVSLPPAKRG
ncbi:hypothetical protein HAX54_006492, partial [Datura stramonium]|nr:hypothetical protein [Datura stramonium]